MPIEFRCPQCSSTLRTPDDSAGKLTACPQCKAELTIPARSASADPFAGLPSSKPAPSADPFAGLPSSKPAPSADPFGSVPSSKASSRPAASGGELNPYAAPTQGLQTSTPQATFGAQGNLDLNDVVGRVWRIFQAQWGLIWGCFIVFFLVALLVSGVANGLQFVARQTKVPVVVGLVVMTTSILSAIVNAWLQTGFGLFMLKVAAGRNPEISDLFAGGKWVISSVGASICFSLMVIFGTLALIIPGIIVACTFWPFQYLILDRDMRAIDSLSAASELTKGQRLNVFGIVLVTWIGGMLIALFTCGLGALVVGPCFALIPAVMYLILSGQPTADQLQYSQTNTYR